MALCKKEKDMKTILRCPGNYLSWIFLFVMVKGAIAQSVSITGTITNPDLMPIRGAVVALYKGGLSATTDASGAFSITGTAGVVSVVSMAGINSIMIENGYLKFSLAGEEQVAFSVFNSRGELVNPVVNQRFNQGSHSISIQKQDAAGLKLLRMKIGSSSYLFKVVNLHCGALSLSAFVTSSNHSLLKSSASVDSLKVTAARYKLLMQGIDSYTQSNLKLVLTSSIDTGIGASLHGNRPFPDDNPWNTPIDKDTLDPLSDKIIAGIGLDVSLHPDFCGQYNGGVCGIPYVVVTAKTPKVKVTFGYAGESDPGPYPIPANAPIEGGATSTGDRHVLIIDRDNWILYELYAAYPPPTSWIAGSGAIFNLESNALRPAGWTSADAAGLPIFPGLVRYDEVVEQKQILHAVRFTVANSRHAYIPPATHIASSLTADTLPPMGMRVRLKASVDISGYSANMQVILKALKTYGMIMADNGSNWYVSGAPDSRFDDNELNTLKQIKGRDFEVVKMRGMVTQ
jgi:hypothetical protein